VRWKKKREKEKEKQKRVRASQRARAGLSFAPALAAVLFLSSHLIELDHSASHEQFCGVNDELGSVLHEQLVELNIVVADSVGHGVAQHARVEVCVTQPLDGLVERCDRAEDDLGVEVVGQLLDELGLDGKLVRQQVQVLVQLVVLADQNGVAALVGAAAELRPTGATENLHDVEHAN